MEDVASEAFDSYDSDQGLDSEDEMMIAVDEVTQAFEQALEELRTGKRVIEIEHGKFRCQCSPRFMTYREIYEHAEDECTIRRSIASMGLHRAMKKYLEELIRQPGHALPLQQVVPRRIDNDNKRVYPWMGILHNIDNFSHTTTAFRIGPDGDDILEHLQEFNPESVKVMHGARGHLGVAVILFRDSMDGCKDAEAFEKSFRCRKRGRRDFEKDYPHSCDGYLYGWMATKKDMDGISKFSIGRLTKYLKLNGDLKSLPEILSGELLIAKNQVENLTEVVNMITDRLIKANEELRSLRNHATEEREQAEREKARLIKHHMKELEYLELQAFGYIEPRSTWLDRTQNPNGMKEHENICPELAKLKLQIEAEKARNSAETLEVKQKDKQIELIKKHKEESDNLENLVQQQREKLQAKHSRELESQQSVAEQLEKGKGKKAEMAKEGKGKEKVDYPDMIRITELQGRLTDLEEDRDAQQVLLTHMTVLHRQAKDEVEDARATILKSRVLQKYGTAEIGLKVLGQINTEGWWEECKDRFGNDIVKFSKWQSRIDAMLRKQNFNPLKVVPDGKGGSKNVVDEDNARLTELRYKYGPTVAKAVGVAALELETWNPSGRYNVTMPWDFVEDQKATMSQIFQRLVLVLQEKELKEIQQRHRLNNTGPDPRATKRRRGQDDAGPSAMPPSSD